MTPELTAKLEACKTLPSPPAVATKIISVANDPEASIDEIAKILAMDPAITAKILRVVNSPMYARRKKTETLQQALIVLGLNATVLLALSFSLLESFQGEDPKDGLDYDLFWRRALLSATTSRVLAETAKIRDAEELFLASLIQDLGMLALDQAVPGIYESLPRQAQQAAITEREREKTGVDHARVGGWLLERWHFPDRINRAVAASHDLGAVPSDEKNGLFDRCVALSSLIAEVFLDEAEESGLEILAEAAQTHLNIDKERLTDLLEEVGALIPDAESVFATAILAQSSTERIMSEAREALVIRSLHALQAVDTLQEQTDSLQSRTKELEDSSRRDVLTGLYNRRYLDKFLTEAFAQAVRKDEPLSVAFADLDNFKTINDTYGHQAGDQILVTTANLLKANVRSDDIVARYGGEEFIIVFPNTSSDLVKIICERIVRSFQEARHDVGATSDLAVTISVGMATQCATRNFESTDVFVNAADKALYSAKLQGRNRSIAFDVVENLKVAQM